MIPSRPLVPPFKCPCPLPLPFPCLSQPRRWSPALSLPPSPYIVVFVLLTSPCHPPYHSRNSMGGYAFNHDSHVPLHWSHSNQLGIFGTPVVLNVQAVVQLLHFFCAVILILTFSSLPLPWLDRYLHHPHDSSRSECRSTSDTHDSSCNPPHLSPLQHRNFSSIMYPPLVPQ